LTALDIDTGKFTCPIGEQGAVIVATKRLTPSMVLGIKPDHVLAFVADEGGLTSHATILARSMNVPIVYGIDIESVAECGTETIVDGSLGKIIIEPDAKTRTYYQKKIERYQKKKLVCEVKKGLAGQTKTGQRVLLKLNISMPSELNVIQDLPHDGIGLLRTEFLFLERNAPPTEDEQVIMYKKALAVSPEKTVTVRVLDIGADKLPAYISFPQNVNLDLSFRGALAVDKFKELYITQMKALLRANGQGNLRLLYPMISDVHDLKTYRSIVTEARAQLKKENVSVSTAPIKEGIMIETPAAVMMIEELLPHVDFVNIGSNDLLQYTLAAMRGNRNVEERYHILHPSLVKMIHRVVRQGSKAKKEVCLCGEVASFEEYYPVLLQLGLHSFSVTIGKFSDVKCELLHVYKQQHKNILETYYGLKNKKETDAYLASFIE